MAGLAALGLSACSEVTNSKEHRGVVDTGVDGGPLKDGEAQLWTDPDGCQHWVIDDGVEGFMSPRLNRDGTPRCGPGNAPVVAKDGTVIRG